MRLIMNDEQLQTVEQVRQFMEGSEAVEFRGVTAKEKYNWIEEVLIRFSYHRIKRAEKGVIPTGSVHTEGYRILQVTGIQTDSGLQTDGGVEENAIQETLLSQEVYPIRSGATGQNRRIARLVNPDLIGGRRSWRGNMRFMDTLSSGIFPRYL